MAVRKHHDRTTYRRMGLFGLMVLAVRVHDAGTKAAGGRTAVA